jgi:excisionase family DNA binding protein
VELVCGVKVQFPKLTADTSVSRCSVPEEHSPEGSTMNESQEFFTPQQLADVLGVNERTLRRERASGLLPFHQVGRAIRHTKADLEEYLKRTQRN